MMEQETKRCTKCGEEYPLTTEYWSRDKSHRTGFKSWCKVCRNEGKRIFYEANSEKERQRRREYRQANLEKVREQERNRRNSNPEAKERKRQYVTKWRAVNADRVRENMRMWRNLNQEKTREYGRKYYKANPEKKRQYIREYMKRNPEYNRNKCRKYREANADKERERKRQYREDNLDKYRVHTHRYRARKRAMPDTLTAQDWQYALTYFNGCCAVCGRQLNDLFGEHTAAMDHWIPLSSDDCPGTTPENIIPLCHGVGGCNNRKQDKDPETWLTETYGARKARQIMARIQAYFDSLGDDEDVA